MIFPVKYGQDGVHDLLRQLSISYETKCCFHWCGASLGSNSSPVILFLLWFYNDGHHFTLLLLNPSSAHLIAQENDAAALAFSELLLKRSLGLIQLIKTQLMFVLMAPQRQPERQASVIPASDEASAQSLYGLQMEENSPTIQYHTL